eukprot:CAMPEP_0195138960 /NCGR_PEP_ID=MMETSP0448-20130528/158521_1 /TAXON_ID=66468 /ORGANISM="Heterocapsa triquestra, Strain CCMP 448" /LENGTH=33 /DNA_ID= /DNA_START= /DNA_END= /DNA_ORIENTATION=
MKRAVVPRGAGTSAPMKLPSAVSSNSSAMSGKL